MSRHFQVLPCDYAPPQVFQMGWYKCLQAESAFRCVRELTTLKHCDTSLCFEIVLYCWRMTIWHLPWLLIEKVNGVHLALMLEVARGYCLFK